MTTKAKARFLLATIIAMVSYILWTFYISEPKYINNINQKQLEAFDWISLPEKYSWEEGNNQSVVNGLVLQIDGQKALVKTEGRYSFSSDDMVEVDIKAHQYRIVGQGTIYHRVNQWVGFNMMLITQIFIGICVALLMITQTKALSDII